MKGLRTEQTALTAAYLIAAVGFSLLTNDVARVVMESVAFAALLALTVLLTEGRKLRTRLESVKHEQRPSGRGGVKILAGGVVAQMLLVLCVGAVLVLALGDIGASLACGGALAGAIVHGWATTVIRSTEASLGQSFMRVRVGVRVRLRSWIDLSGVIRTEGPVS